MLPFIRRRSSRLSKEEVSLGREDSDLDPTRSLPSSQEVTFKDVESPQEEEEEEEEAEKEQQQQQRWVMDS